jgi:hypothetical protein
MVKIAPQVQAVGQSRVPRDGPSASKPLRQRIKPCRAGSGRRPVVRFQHWGLAKCYSGLESSGCGGLVRRRTVLRVWLVSLGLGFQGLAPSGFHLWLAGVVFKGHLPVGRLGFQALPFWISR